MFALSVLLNSLLLYVVTKKDKFDREKRSFHKLFQVLISLDLAISILILPNILIKKLSEDTAIYVWLDAYLGLRDFSIAAQSMTLVLIAIDRLLVFVLPLSNFWRLYTVMTVLKVAVTVMAVFFLSRFILLTVKIRCEVQKSIDAYYKLFIGVTGGVLLLITLVIYLVLFTLLCRRQIVRHRESFATGKYFRSIKTTENSYQQKNGYDKEIKIETISKPPVVNFDNTVVIRRKERLKKSLTKLKIPRMGSIKFVKVLFGVNVLMIISYVPALLYNLHLIKFPSYSVYYLFFLHALGDPILFFMIRKELRNSLISILQCK